MPNANIQIEITALDNASRALDAIDRSLGPMARKVDRLEDEFDGVDRSINRTSGSFGRLRGLLAGAITVAGVTSFTNSVLDSYGASQDLKVALETVTGSASEADRAFAFIRDFTESTPFQVENVSEAFVKLANAGIEPTAELLTTLGDAASVSTDKVGALTAIADLYSRTVQGGLGVEELDRLQERGIPVYDILSEKLEIARQDVSEYGKTAAGAAEITAALTEGFNERFGGGMERASETLNGRLSTLSDTMDGLLIKVGEGGLGDAIQNVVEKFTDFISTNEELALALGEKLGQAVTLAADGVIFLFENADKAKPIFDLLGLVFNDVIVPALGFMFDALVKVSEILTPLIETSIPIAKTLFEGLANIMTTIVIPAFESVIDTIGRIIDRIQGMIDWISAGIDKVSEFGGGVASTVSNGFNRAGDTIGGWAENVNNWGASVYDEWIGNSYIPDLVYGIGKYMDMLPREMVDPARRAVEATNSVMERSPLTSLPTSPVSGVGQGIAQTMGSGIANSNVNFNISGVNAGGGTGQFQNQQMRQYIEGIALQVAMNTLRQNTRIGGLI